jgi:AcrR family transcriptional regulator
MGNREDLLAGAKQCLMEKGYSRTTARDIAAAAGTSLAAIGYHFRTTQALLNAALFETMAEWGDEVARVLATEVEPGATPAERFERTWSQVIRSFTEQRRLWATQLEMITAAEHVPELREQFVPGLAAARLGLAELFAGLDPATDPERARRVGSLHQALLTGVLVQHLVDPASAPSGHDLVEALRMVCADLNPAT